MRTKISLILVIAIALGISVACRKAEEPARRRARDAAQEPQWTDLFAADLSDAEFPAGIWTVADGVITASEDQALWTKKDYENFVLDLEFMTAPGTNSGVIVYCSDMANWIPNSVEVQIADDFAEEWAKAPATWHCGADLRPPRPDEERGQEARRVEPLHDHLRGQADHRRPQRRAGHRHGHEPVDLGQDQSRRQRDPGLAEPAQGRAGDRRGGSASRASTPARRSTSGTSGSGTSNKGIIRPIGSPSPKRPASTVSSLIPTENSSRRGSSLLTGRVQGVPQGGQGCSGTKD